MATFCDSDPKCPAEIRDALIRIEEAAGDYSVGADNPCGLAAYYDHGDPKPWRIADDYASECFATAEEAEDAAGDWADSMGN